MAKSWTHVHINMTDPEEKKKLDEFKEEVRQLQFILGIESSIFPPRLPNPIVESKSSSFKKKDEAAAVAH